MKMSIHCISGFTGTHKDVCISAYRVYKIMENKVGTNMENAVETRPLLWDCSEYACRSLND